MSTDDQRVSDPDRTLSNAQLQVRIGYVMADSAWRGQLVQRRFTRVYYTPISARIHVPASSISRLPCLTNLIQTPSELAVTAAGCTTVSMCFPSSTTCRHLAVHTNVLSTRTRFRYAVWLSYLANLWHAPRLLR